MEIVLNKIEFQFSMYSKTISAGSRRKGKHYKSDHTQTCQNTTILYYHESKKSSFDDPLHTTPLLDEDENDNIIVSPDQEEKFLVSQHRWKKKIPSCKFGAIIKAKGKYDAEFMANKCKFQVRFDLSFNNSVLCRSFH